MNFPKVLVAAPVNERKSYCLQEYLDNNSQLTYPNKHFYFVDNSKDDKWHIRAIGSHGLECDYVQPHGRHQDYITLSQEMIRHKAIKGNFDFLFMKESDIITSPDIIEEMISYNSPIVTANYFIGQGEKSRLLMMEIDKNPYGITTNRNITGEENFLEYVLETNRSSMHGMGCLMLHRSVFTKFHFHVSPNDSSHCDTYFWFDIQAAGIPVVVHPVIVVHKNSSWELINDSN